jgi:4-hydroxy-4-methyl-2-oxoglutarate aldolase
VGDVAVEPGDWVVGDVDGVVVVPGATIDDVLSAGLARAEKERALFGALRGGATTVEQFGLDTGLIDGA